MGDPVADHASHVRKNNNISNRNSNEYKNESEDAEFWPLSASGNPNFDIVLSKTHLHPNFRLVLPRKMYPVLPCLVLPVVLTYRGKKWNMMYDGTKDSYKKFDSSWRIFAEHNNLKIGDACVFELKQSDSKKLVFRVQILRGHIPPQLLHRIVGESPDSPIIIK